MDPRVAPDFEKICGLDSLPLGSSLVVQMADKPVALVHCDAGVFAFEDYCPHRAGPLSEGPIEGTEITCGWHGAKFNLATGACLSGPTKQNLKTRKVKADAGFYWVEKAESMKS
jgi:nitrite reductase/ring-hydroxylating ferredoxin subunit